MALPLPLVLKRPAEDGTLARQERTVAEDVSRGGARVPTSFADLRPGDELEVEEDGGGFHTRVAVRSIVTGADGVPRLGLEFLDRPAPERLVPGEVTAEAAPTAAVPSADPVARGEDVAATPGERRGDTRLDICVDVRIKGPAEGAGTAAREERTVADNISRGGARVLTSMTRLARGDVVTLSEVGGDFETRAAVRSVTVGSDNIPRLGLKFLDRRAPDRLVLTDDARVSRARGAEHGATTPESLAALDAEAETRRREVLDSYVALKQRNHFEVLGLPRSATADDVKAAYARLVRRFHPDTGAEPGLEDLQDERKAIFVRLGEAYEVLADPQRRAEYETRLGPSRARKQPAAAPAPAERPPARVSAAPAPAARASAPPAPAARASAPPATVSLPTVSMPPAAVPRAAARPAPVPTGAHPPPPLDRERELALAEDALFRARELVANHQYWDAVQVLEPALALAVGSELNRRVRVLLARTLARNPKWLKRAEELLLKVVEEDAASVEGHFGLAEVYLAARLKARARHELERVLALRPGHRGATRALASIGSGQ